MLTFSEYDELCRTLADNRLRSVTVTEAMDSPASRALILKHDIEANLDKALETARIENRHGHRCTYYLHSFFATDFNRQALDELASLGHEVGYHYDVLDEADGDYSLALTDFSESLRKFQQQGVSVRTICPHGNPLKRRTTWRSNKDFFKNPDIVQKFPELFDIVNQGGEKFPQFAYYSDAGYQLKQVGDIRGNDVSNESAITDGERRTVENLVSVAATDQLTTVVSIHPHRLERFQALLSLRKALFFSARYVARTLSRVHLARQLLSLMYRHTKKI